GVRSGRRSAGPGPDRSASAPRCASASRRWARAAASSSAPLTTWSRRSGGRTSSPSSRRPENTDATTDRDLGSGELLPDSSKVIAHLVPPTPAPAAYPSPTSGEGERKPPYLVSGPPLP